MNQAEVDPSGNNGASSVIISPEMPRSLFLAPPRPSPPAPPNLDKRGEPIVRAVVPVGVALLSRGVPVTGSDPMPIGSYSMVTDGEKSCEDDFVLDLQAGQQWVQLDLGASREIWLVWLWHDHKIEQIYNDVVGLISDDPEFKTASTIFNNDWDNSSGFGAGSDQSYIETNNGRCIPVSGIKGRYVRFYSRGRETDDTNQYTEIEVYGK